MKHIVIIGNGIAGVTAARYIRKFSGIAITLKSKYRCILLKGISQTCLP